MTSPFPSRSIALIGHSGCGKTTLAEAMLLRAGTLQRAGRVEDGTATTDFEPEETKRHHSVGLGLATLEWEDHAITLLDTPGYPDFCGEVEAALAAADAAMLVLDAASGVEVGSELTWRRAEAASVPRIIVINKLERENADFRNTVDQCRDRFGKPAAPLHLPIYGPDGIAGIIDLLHMVARFGGDLNHEPIPGEYAEEAAQLRERLVEAVAEADDALIERYLAGEPISDDEVIQGLHDATREGRIFPILAASALGGRGLGLLLDALLAMAPDASEHRALDAEEPDGDHVSVSADPDGPVAAYAFRVLADPYVGRLTFLKVVRGTLRPDSHVLNVRTGTQERLGQLLRSQGKQQDPVSVAHPGDIVAVAKLASTQPGDTLAAPDSAVILPPIAVPGPRAAVAIAPKSKADMDKLGQALNRLVEEDPSLSVRKDADTGETILAGQGDTHLEVTIERLHRKFGVEVTQSLPRVPYRETLAKPIRSEYKHKKQTGGHGQYGHVVLDLEPLPSGSGFEFAEKVVGGAVPRNFYPAVEKGLHEALDHGVLAGYPIVDIRATLVDGSSHAVDSSEMAFKLAASHALRKGLADAGSVLLEPVWKLEITVPDEFQGDILGDLNHRRAHVEGSLGDGVTATITATAPLAEVQQYAAILRSLTQGRGTFSMAFDHYAPVPAHLVPQITAATGT